MHDRFNRNEQALIRINDTLPLDQKRLQLFTADVYDWYFERWIRKLNSFMITENKWTLPECEGCNICFENFQINQRIISLS